MQCDSIVYCLCSAYTASCSIPQCQCSVLCTSPNRPIMCHFLKVLISTAGTLAVYIQVTLHMAVQGILHVQYILQLHCISGSGLAIYTAPHCIYTALRSGGIPRKHFRLIDVNQALISVTQKHSQNNFNKPGLSHDVDREVHLVQDNKSIQGDNWGQDTVSLTPRHPLKEP